VTASETIAEKLVEWARAVLPELQGGYTYSIGQKDQGLPDVVADVEEIEVTLQDSRFPMPSLQQAHLVARPCTLSFMVENEDRDGNSRADQAAQDLRGFADRLVVAARADVTLGGRVPFISPFFRFDFTPPFVEYRDGTKGREMRLELTVGETL
jgi:hypothetical protein